MENQLLQAKATRPQYDRDSLKARIVHLGFGAFHRAHQAVYTDILAAEQGSDWGYCEVNLIGGEQQIADLKAQDNLYTVAEMSADAWTARVVGVVKNALHAQVDGLETVLAALCVLAWGYFLHQGVVDPLGGINTLWPLFGIANQMLAGMALMLCAVVLFKMKRQRYAWVALVPTAWLLICTLTAGWQKAFSPDNKVGFLAIANKFQAMIDSGKIPAQYTESQLSQLVFNNRLDAGLTIFFMVVVVVLALYSLKTALAALKVDTPTAKETPYEPMPENLDKIVTQAKGAH